MDIISLGEILSKYLVFLILILIFLMLVIIYLFAKDTPEYKGFIKNLKYKFKIRKINKLNFKYNVLIQKSFKALDKKKINKLDRLLRKINKIRNQIEILNKEGDKK